jgi:hypothetical protein
MGTEIQVREEKRGGDPDFGKPATVDIFERIEFCQSQPVFTSTGWRMVRNPYTAMSKDCVSLLSWNNKAEFLAWRNAIATCGIELTRGVPVWEAWYKKLWVPHSKDYATDHVYDSGMGYAAKGVIGGEITWEARYSFYLAYGILPHDQIALEESIPDVCWLQPAPIERLADLSPFTQYFLYAKQKNQQRPCHPIACGGPATSD